MTRDRTEEADSSTEAIKNQLPCTFIDFSDSVQLSVCRLSCDSFSLSLFQDYDAVSSEEHQNPCQVLVPQELPIPDFQGRIFFFPIAVTLEISWHLTTDIDKATAIANLMAAAFSVSFQQEF